MNAFPERRYRPPDRTGRLPSAVPAGGRPRSGFWNERTVAWYRRAVERGDYAARILEAMGAALDRCEDALDVGAGCGALALPLARRLRTVTALEPTPAMAAELRRWAAEAGLTNITVVEAAWGEVPVRPHDLVLCAHVSGLLRGDSSFLCEVATLARRRVVIVRDAPGAQRDDKFFFGELYPTLLGRPYEHRCDAEERLEALGRLAVRPTVKLVEYASDQPFSSLDEACDFWMTYLGLEGTGPRAYLEGFLRERLVRRGSEWIAPFRKAAAVMIWEVDAPPSDGSASELP